MESQEEVRNGEVRGWGLEKDRGRAGRGEQGKQQRYKGFGVNAILCHNKTISIPIQ